MKHVDLILGGDICLRLNKKKLVPTSQTPCFFRSNECLCEVVLLRRCIFVLYFEAKKILKKIGNLLALKQGLWIVSGIFVLFITLNILK